MPMSLRQLLTFAHENDAVTALADAARERDGGAAERAFVSASLRPYLMAALLGEDPARAALVRGGGGRRGPRSWWRATTARPATSPPTSRCSSPLASCASTRRAASATSRTSRRHHT